MDIASQLLKFARQDMATARREGHMLIAQTTRGTIAVEYDRDAKRYTVATCGIDTTDLISNGKAADTAAVIANLYDVA